MVIFVGISPLDLISARYAAVASNNVLDSVFVEQGTALEVSTAENLLNNL